MLSIQRVVFLMALILSIFATMIWFEKGTPVYPYPLNDIFFFVACIFAFYLHPKPLARAIIFFLIGLIGFLTNSFFHETVFSLNQLQELYDSPIIDVLFLVKYILLISCGIYLVKNFRNLLQVVLIVLSITAIVLTALNFTPIVTVYILLSVLATLADKHNVFNYLLYLLVFLELSKHFTEFIN